MISDYRVSGLVDAGLAEHVWADGTDLGPDPDLTVRGRAAHAAVQDQFDRALTALGLTPLQPQPYEPRYDLAWRNGSHVWVVEVKSTTVANEVRQCRCPIGQVQHYAVQLLADHEHVHPVIVLENRPADESLVAACERCGILVLWPEVFDAIPTAPPL